MFETLRRVMKGNNDTLKIKCLRCSHTRTWTREQAFAIFGPDAAPYDISSKSKCSACSETGMIRAYI